VLFLRQKLQEKHPFQMRWTILRKSAKIKLEYVCIAAVACANDGATRYGVRQNQTNSS
jgi:hypothetical protein